MKKTSQIKTKFFVKFLLVVLSVILIAAMIVVYWLYSGNLTQNKTKVFNLLPLPIAKVDGTFIPMRSYIFRQFIASKLLAQTEPAANKQILNKLILEAQVEALAKRFGVRVANKELEDSFLLAKNAPGSFRETSLESFLNNANLSESNFKEQVLLPELLLTNLKIWQNSQRNLNEDAYILADSLIKQLQNGERMADLASRFSSDSVEKNIGGDVGFIDPAQALPELKEPLFKLQTGEVKILPSRLGLHIIKAEDKQGNLTHFSEIFLKNYSFDSWFKTQTQNFKIKIYFNI